MTAKMVYIEAGGNKSVPTVGFRLAESEEYTYWTVKAVKEVGVMASCGGVPKLRILFHLP